LKNQNIPLRKASKDNKWYFKALKGGRLEKKKEATKLKQAKLNNFITMFSR
jgi:hypothetical protein